jgi:RimJ/RimL family protein N-acetyltransferase
MTAVMLPYPTVLEGSHVRLAPTDRADAPGLFAALTDPSIWTWLTAPLPDDAETMQGYVDAALDERARGVRWPWTVRLLDGTVVGWTSYGDIEPAHERIEIGWTSYGVPWQRTAVNTETKLLLLGHAFDDLGYSRVALKTDLRNERSQRAIERLGAVREGVLRRHQRRADGTIRDSVYYSILVDEWPAVRARLVARLADAGQRP